VVPVEQADLLHAALTGAGCASTLARLPEADHLLGAPGQGITPPDAWSGVEQRALAFFRAHLRA
jgi:dipeptidyl aminopeptidase/acylaminoacyl peptidase